MKLNPLKFNSQKFNPFKKLLPSQDESGAGLASYDESVLQQGRFWMRTVTWSLIGTTVFGVAWLALARTEEIVVAPGQLEPIGSVQDIQMPVGGVADQILVKEGDRVKAGQVLMKLDTEASEEQRLSIEKSIKLKEEQLKLKEKEKLNTMQMNQEEVQMRRTISRFTRKFWSATAVGGSGCLFGGAIPQSAKHRC